MKRNKDEEEKNYRGKNYRGKIIGKNYSGKIGTRRLKKTSITPTHAKKYTAYTHKEIHRKKILNEIRI